MPMRIPEGNNPYGVSVAVGDTTQMGLVEMKENRFSTNRMVSNLGAQFDKTLTKWIDDIDETKNRENANALQSFLNNQKMNKDTGWANLKGKNALERPNGMSLEEETAESFKREYERLYEGCGTGRQRRKLKEMYDAFNVQRQQQVAGHVIAQKGVWKADVDRETLNQGFHLATDYDNEVNHKSGIEVLRATGMSISADAGVKYDPGKYEGPAHAEVVSSLVTQGRSEEAQKYLSENGGNMNAEQYSRSKRLVEAGLKSDQAEAFAAGIIKKGGKYSEMLKAAETAPKDIRDKVRSNVRLQIGAMKEAEAQELRELHLSANKEWADTGKISDETQELLKQKDPAFYMRYRASMEAIEKRRAAGESPYPKFDDAVTKRQLEKLIEEDPKTFMQIDFDRDANYIGALTEKTCNYFKAKQKFINDDSANYLDKAVEKYCRLEGIKGDGVMKAKQFVLKVYESRYGSKPDKFASKKEMDDLALSALQMSDRWNAMDSSVRAYESYDPEKQTVEEFAVTHDWQYGNEWFNNELKAKGINPEGLNATQRSYYGAWRSGKGWPKPWVETAIKGLEKERDDYIKRGGSDPGPVKQSDIDEWVLIHFYKIR